MTLEHRLIYALGLICAALLGMAIASAEIISQIDWVAADSNCAAAGERPAVGTSEQTPVPLRT